MYGLTIAQKPSIFTVPSGACYLKPLKELTERGETPAEQLLRKFHGPWGGSVDPVYTEYAY